MKKKKYLKPQVDVAQTGPCMMINPSQVRIYPDFVTQKTRIL